MRIMVKFRFPNNPGNELVRSGRIEQIFGKIMEDLKPEVAYFFPENGMRAGLLVINAQDSSDVAKTAEPFFLGLGAEVDLVPVMSGEDLQKGLSGMQSLVERYS